MQHMIITGNAFAQASGALPSPGELKKLSMEELMDLEVTSVSRRPEKVNGGAIGYPGNHPG